jgi:hypothetical protein
MNANPNATRKSPLRSTVADRLVEVREDLAFCKMMVANARAYLEWDLANPWDGKGLRPVPFLPLPDNYKRDMERPNADVRQVYRTFIADYLGHITEDERWIKAVENHLVKGGR